VLGPLRRGTGGRGREGEERGEQKQASHWRNVYHRCYDMSTLTGTLAHALLGVLAEGPRTGYALVRHLAQSIAYTWPASHSQVYPELAKLREAGLIGESASAPRGGRVYEITDAGLAEVRRWLRETEPSRTVRDEASLRLFFLWLLEPEEAAAYLRGEAERARATLAEFEQIAAQEDPDTPKTRAYRTALDLGLHAARAKLAWAESALTASARHPR
jgi:PadR family transcriptional regulator, regulatory protein AphA